MKKVIIAICAALILLLVLFVRYRPRKLNPEALARERAAARTMLALSRGTSVLVGAGDVAGCPDLSGAETTARILDRTPGTVFVAGDLAYEDGSDEEFADCYGPTWGRHKERTRPAPGNHEYRTPNAAPYFRYFGAAAGEPGRGYYSYDLAGWHIVVINSMCGQVGGCNAGSPQERWLRQDLAEHPAACTLAYWHRPLFSSGEAHGDAPEMKPMWEALYQAGAEVVINGHDHDYERFAPQNPEGQADPVNGIREFVVGTGGRSTRPFGEPLPNSEVRNTGTFGVLKLSLRHGSYDWQFIPAERKGFTDSGSGVCH